jgi:hypothetical protein
MKREQLVEIRFSPNSNGERTARQRDVDRVAHAPFPNREYAPRSNRYPRAAVPAFPRPLAGGGTIARRNLRSNQLYTPLRIAGCGAFAPFLHRVTVGRLTPSSSA